MLIVAHPETMIETPARQLNIVYSTCTYKSTYICISVRMSVHTYVPARMQLPSAEYASVVKCLDRLAAAPPPMSELFDPPRQRRSNEGVVKEGGDMKEQ